MSVPSWQTSTKGAGKRVAMWLHDEVGEGGTFTKADLREAFPGVQQIDRRMRDLRACGWVIDDYRVDRSLASSDELRLVKIGDAVWVDGYRRHDLNTVTNKQRQAVFASDNYQCLLCGIAGGEPYFDETTMTAKLTLARVVVLGRAEPMLRTVCDRCRAGGEEDSVAEQAVLAEIARLDDDQRRRLRAWVAAGARQPSPEDHAWSRYRRLPAEARREIEQHLNLS